MRLVVFSAISTLGVPSCCPRIFPKSQNCQSLTECAQKIDQFDPIHDERPPEPYHPEACNVVLEKCRLLNRTLSDSRRAQSPKSPHTRECLTCHQVPNHRMTTPGSSNEHTDLRCPFVCVCPSVPFALCVSVVGPLRLSLCVLACVSSQSLSLDVILCPVVFLCLSV